MSNIFLAHLATPNPIDIKLIDNNFNADFSSTGVVVPVGDGELNSYLSYRGSEKIIDDSPSNYFFYYTIENGYQLFSRTLYGHMNVANKTFVSRQGKEISIGSPIASPMNSQSQEQMFAQLRLKDSPPKQELSSLFDYILSLNTYFYLFFNDFRAEGSDYWPSINLKIDSFSRTYFNDLAKNKKIIPKNHQEALNLLIRHFDSKTTSFTAETSDIEKSIFKISK